MLGKGKIKTTKTEESKIVTVIKNEDRKENQYQNIDGVWTISGGGGKSSTWTRRSGRGGTGGS